jgi:monovalent cation:H+ antiporter, CPA1 family
MSTLCRHCVALPVELILAVILGISLAASLASRRTRVPYTIFLVFIGIAVAASSSPTLAPLYQTFTTLLGGGVFVGIILPPLLFESTLSISTSEFRAVSRPALVLATGGVVLATVLVGVILLHLTNLPPLTAFLFAALIAPTDVATVLEIFHRTVVPSRLSTLMETESILNDATGIALLTVILTSFEASSSSAVFINAAGRFALVFGGGVIVGLGFAWAARQLQRVIQDPVSQIVLTMTAVYGSYGVASAAGVSGLIAVAVTGLLYGNTILFKIHDSPVEQATRQFWSVLAFLANTIAFLFIGLSTNILSLAGSLTFVLIAFGVVLLSRFATVYSILSIPKIAQFSVPWSWKNVTMLGGMRGALSIALVASLPIDLPGYTTVVNMTFGVVILSILLQGPILTTYATKAFGRQRTLTEGKPAVTETEEPQQTGPPETEVPDSMNRLPGYLGNPSPAEALSPDLEGRKQDELR